MKIIQLQNSLLPALVDDEDFEKFGHIKFYLTPDGYARTSYNPSRGWLSNANLHRLVLNLSYGDSQVDHKDRNKLNCQKDNLRLCSHTQNQINKAPQKTKKSCPYKGVYNSSKRKSPKKWFSQITINGVRIHLGWFLTAEEAAKSYDKYALIHFKEYAYLNFPEIKQDNPQGDKNEFI